MKSKPAARRRVGTIGLKRVYDKSETADGTRVLVDRVWPRGLSKADVAVHHWFKDLAPSTALRKWFAHDPDKWHEFRRRYHAELDENDDALLALLGLLDGRHVTLVYASRDTARNNAVALRDYLESTVA